MMNELYMMSQNLKRFGLIQSITHRDIGQVAENSGLIVEINMEGLPISIDFCDKERFNKFYTHRKGNHNSFPIIRIQRPLLAAPMVSDKDVFESMNWENINSKSMDIVVKSWTVEQLLPICEENAELASLCELIRRFPKDPKETLQFNNALVELIRNCFDTMSKSMKGLVKDILIGTGNKKIQIAFDIDDAYKYSFNVRDSRLWSLLIRKFCERDKTDSMKKPVGVCQLTGEKQVIEKNKYPNPKLKVVGNTFLYIKNESNESLTRYELNGLNAYSAGKNAVGDIENAIIYLTDDSREYITWSKIPGSTSDQVNLLLSYVVEAPNSNEKIAKLLGNGMVHEQEEVRFEELSKQVCGRLKEYKEINASASVQVIVINKVDDGRKQVLLSQSYASNDIIIGTDRWKQASKESLPIRYRFQEKGSWKEVSTYCPYPGEIIRIMSKLWRMERKENIAMLSSSSIPSLTLKEVYGIFIPTSEETSQCQAILQRALRNFQTLMLYMGHSDNRQEVSMKNKSNIYDTCLAASLLSILLYKLGSRKEDTMHSAGYQIGQVMKLADILHREYCRVERNNSMPPQLIGNSLMAIALETPNKSLAMLAERIRIYIAWSDTEKNQEVRLAKWVQKQLGNTCAELGDMNIPDEFNEAQRAQLLLGYLAKIENMEG